MVYKHTVIALFFILCINVAYIYSAPQQGIFNFILGENGEARFVKTLYNQSTISIIVTANGDQCSDKVSQFYLQWLVRSSTCYGEYVALKSDPGPRLRSYITQPFMQVEGGGLGEYQVNFDLTDIFSPSNDKLSCTEHETLDDYSKKVWHVISPLEKEKEVKTNKESTTASTENEKKSNPSRKRRDDLPNAGSSDISNNDNITKTAKVTEKSAILPKQSSDPNHLITKVAMEGAYLVVIWIRKIDDYNPKNGSFNITLKMRTPKGYLSAHEYPLLTFYMIMCIIYVFYAFAWLVLSACNYKDLLRVQFWIGAVILLGMIEKAVFYSEYLSVNTTGQSVLGAAKFAEIVSALKRSLARMLCIIVSLGFGIVKPRLGPMLHRVIGVGVLYFVLAVVEALVRQDADLHDPDNNTLLFTYIPLSILDAIICWWIFMSLMQTMKTLRLRRNVTKLSLYRHFSNAIIFCVIASLIMTIWSVRMHQDLCMADWSELWVEQAFWHILFSVVLLVIIVLWRPNVNNQRYAFSPLIDGVDEENDVSEPMLGSGATETMKMRGLKSDSSMKNPNEKVEDDLKWIEENIPQTVADAALPALVDSDEEIMTTKYEMNKME